MAAPWRSLHAPGRGVTEVSRTLSEIRATCTKAARGAGCDWGMAEEAGLAARLLESHDLPGVRVLSRLLSVGTGCASCRKASSACGLQALAALSDRLPFLDDALPDGPVRAPLLLAAPVILLAREQGAAYTLSWEGAVLRCTQEGVSAEGAVDAPLAAFVSLEAAPGSLGRPRAPDWRSRSIAESDWDMLERLAAKTLVPETEASRARGAGPADAAAD
jgi:hypothetical protein